MHKQYDVIVTGGGTAGVIAAVQAARAGAHTLLVEKNGILGGTITTAGINAPAHFFAWGRQVIGGIGWELVKKTLKEMGQPVPGPEATRGKMRLKHNIKVNKAIFAALCDEAVMIKGKKTMTVDDYESGRFYDDAVCYAYYPIDEHKNDGQKSNYRLLKENVLPTVPRGALLPAGSSFLIVAGRCISSDHETNSAVRVECPCMAMGQAAGAMIWLTYVYQTVR